MPWLVRTVLVVAIFPLQLGPVCFHAVADNDRFVNAEVITGTSGTVVGSTVSANKENGEPDHADNPGGSSIWYRWTAPSTGPYSFNTFGSSFDTLLAVYTGNSVGALTVVAANDDYGLELTSEVGFTANVGTTYSIAVDGYDDESGAVTLNWLLEVPPLNDLFTNAMVLTGSGGSIISSNIGAGKEVGEPNHAGEPGGRSVWFRWTAPGTGDFTFDIAASGIETLLAIYTGASVNALTLVASNSVLGSASSSATFPAVAGTTYSIAMDGAARMAGVFTLHWFRLSDDTVTGTLQTLHAFTNFNDGGSPFAGLTLSGNTLYGASLAGAGYGTLFKVNTDGTGYAILHRFLNFNAGAHPYAPPLVSGNTLYGTTRSGGSNGNGTVFALNTNGTGYTNLHHFAAGTLFPKTNSNGALPQAGLVISGNRLYGTTTTGGASANGTLFALNTDGTGFAVLYHFSGMSGDPGTNSGGATPHAALVLSGDTLYGSALNGGPFGYGTIFAIHTNGTDFRTLHAFRWSFDGAWPRNLSLAGNRLYGAGNGGGLTGNGSVFAINTDGTGFTNLYSFTEVMGATYTNKFGANPFGGVVFDKGRLYGSAFGGGSGGRGTLFSMNTNGTDLWLLHSFTAGSGPSGTNYDGARPRCTPAVSGNSLFGTSESGGELAWGTVYRVSWGVEQPLLAITSSGNHVVLAWNEAGSFRLESAPNLGLPNSWSTVNQVATTNSGQISVTVPTTNGSQFFRLVNP
jgi:uncharacterized repeat protein (TIGR03803 family)